MKLSTTTLLAAALFVTGPALAQAAAPVEEAETDIEIINGIPVNPELKAKIMESEEALSVQELIDLSNKVLDEQKKELQEQQKLEDRSWMGEDPLGHLEGEMHDLVQDIDGSDTADLTQAQGQDVVRKMDTLIALMEQASSACSSCAGGGSGPGQGPANGNNPAQDSTLAAGPGGSGDLTDKGTGNNRFEDLDPEQRDAILRAQENERGFPAEYDALLSEYFRRLASEEALSTTPDEEDSDTPEGE